jgi:hypothetical protein
MIMQFKIYCKQSNNLVLKTKGIFEKSAKPPFRDTKMSAINYELLSEIIFMNDSTFKDITIKKAKIIARTCKVAKINKNIRLSYDKCKIDIYYKQIMFLSIEKTEKEFDENILDETSGEMNLNINKKYKRKIYNIIISLLKEDDNIIEGVKEKIITEQKKHISKYFIKLHVKLSIIRAYNNISDDEDDAETFENDDNYNNVQFEIAFIITNFKYNAYFINMLSKTLVNEKDVIKYISSKYFTDNWYKIPIIFPENYLKNHEDEYTNLIE